MASVVNVNATIMVTLIDVDAFRLRVPACPFSFNITNNIMNAMKPNAKFQFNLAHIGDDVLNEMFVESLITQ